MQALKLPAIAGLIWVSAGFRLMGQQFLRLFSIVIVYFFAFMLVMSFAIILSTALAPLGIDAGVVARGVWFVAGILSPIVSIGFMEACRSITRGEAVSPIFFFRGFQAARPVVLSLLCLGLIQISALTFLTSFLPSTDMSLEALKNPPVAADTPVDWDAVKLQLVLMVPIFLVVAALWYAPMLVAWHKLRPLKAMFFSLAACWRNKGAFFLFFAGWVMMFSFLLFAGVQLYTLLGSNAFGSTLVAMMVLITSGAIYCSIYVSYSTVFVAPPASVTAEPEQV